VKAVKRTHKNIINNENGKRQRTEECSENKKKDEIKRHKKFSLIVSERAIESDFGEYMRNK
jgi:ferritin-like protein